MDLPSPPQTDTELIRNLFASQEELSAAQALIVYPDERLDRAREADPRRFERWVNQAKQALNS